MQATAHHATEKASYEHWLSEFYYWNGSTIDYGWTFANDNILANDALVALKQIYHDQKHDEYTNYTEQFNGYEAVGRMYTYKCYAGSGSHCWCLRVSLRISLRISHCIRQQFQQWLQQWLPK